MKKSISLLALASILLSSLASAQTATAARSYVPHSSVLVYTGDLTEDCTATLGGVSQGKPIIMTASAKEKVMGIQADRNTEVQLTVSCDGASAVYKGIAGRDTRFSFTGSSAGLDSWSGYVGLVPGLKVNH